MLLTAYFETTYRFLRDHLEYGLARREKNDEDTFNKDLNTYTYQKHVVKFLWKAMEDLKVRDRKGNRRYNSLYLLGVMTCRAFATFVGFQT
jgi:hypothetical protein